MKNNEIGKKGEQCCIHHLQGQKWEIINNNFHCPYGEIDIIAIDDRFLVFIEVKTRTKETVDSAMLSISRSKQKKLTKTAMFFLSTYKNSEIMEFRFDVMIANKKEEAFEITHIKNAFEPSEVGEFFA